jgi:hypothetical protein
MFIKYCAAKHSLAKECTTIGLGTLQSYADDDPEFLRCDYEEGELTIINSGAVEIDSHSVTTLTGGAMRGLKVAVNPDGKFSTKYRFPNSYIFCLSQSSEPTADIARKIDKAYDDWYAITKIYNFIHRTAELLLNQLKVSDFELSDEMSLQWLRGLKIQVVNRECSYEGRELAFNQETLQHAVEASKDVLRWAFAKDSAHGALHEYRILFLVIDSENRIVPVKKNIKVLNLLPDFGVATNELTESEWLAS